MWCGSNDEATVIGSSKTKDRKMKTKREMNKEMMMVLDDRIQPIPLCRECGHAIIVRPDDDGYVEWRCARAGCGCGGSGLPGHPVNGVGKTHKVCVAHPDNVQTAGTGQPLLGIFPADEIELFTDGGERVPMCRRCRVRMKTVGEMTEDETRQWLVSTGENPDRDFPRKAELRLKDDEPTPDDYHWHDLHNHARKVWIEMRCDRLFAAKHGRSRVEGNGCRCCRPHSQREAEWLAEMSIEHFDGMVNAWSDPDCDLTIGLYMGDTSGDERSE
jgi:hypothetical protein